MKTECVGLHCFVEKKLFFPKNHVKKFNPSKESSVEDAKQMSQLSSQESPILFPKKRVQKTDASKESPIPNFSRKKKKNSESSESETGSDDDIFLDPNIRKYTDFTRKERHFLEDLYQEIGYTQSKRILKIHLSKHYGYLLNFLPKVKKWFHNRHDNKKKIRVDAKHDQKRSTQLIFVPNLNTSSPCISYLPGCFDCAISTERQLKCTTCMLVFHKECIQNIDYENLELSTLRKCPFC